MWGVYYIMRRGNQFIDTNILMFVVRTISSRIYIWPYQECFWADTMLIFNERGNGNTSDEMLLVFFEGTKPLRAHSPVTLSPVLLKYDWQIYLSHRQTASRINFHTSLLRFSLITIEMWTENVPLVRENKVQEGRVHVNFASDPI